MPPRTFSCPWKPHGLSAALIGYFCLVSFVPSSSDSSSSFLSSITPLPYTPFSSSHDCNRRHTTLHWTSLPLLFITFHSRNQRSNCHSSTLRSIVLHSSHDILNTDSSSDSVLTMDKISHFHRFKKSILAFWKFQEKIRSELDELSIQNFNKMQVILRDLEIYFILFYGW